MSACLFCRIAAKEIPAQIVYEDAAVLAFRDINPQAPTHVLIIPKRHISGIPDATADNATDSEPGGIYACLFQAVRLLATQERIAESGFRAVINSGADAGQSVDHLHIHLLGGRHLCWPPG